MKFQWLISAVGLEIFVQIRCKLPITNSPQSDTVYVAIWSSKGESDEISQILQSSLSLRFTHPTGAGKMHLIFQGDRKQANPNSIWGSQKQVICTPRSEWRERTSLWRPKLLVSRAAFIHLHSVLPPTEGKQMRSFPCYWQSRIPNQPTFPWSLPPCQQNMTCCPPQLHNQTCSHESLLHSQGQENLAKLSVT